MGGFGGPRRGSISSGLRLDCFHDRYIESAGLSAVHSHSLLDGSLNGITEIHPSLTSFLVRFISSRIFPMDPLRELGRSLLLLRGFLLLLGALLYFGGQLLLRLARLPRDIIHRVR